MAAVRRLVAVVKSGEDEEEFVVVRQNPPQKPSGEEYEKYVDSDLFDLPSVSLKSLEGVEKGWSFVVDGAEEFVELIDLRKFDVESAVDEVLSQVGVGFSDIAIWKFLKYLKEPEFGPEPFVDYIFILGVLKGHVSTLPEGSTWMDASKAEALFSNRDTRSDRIGPLFVRGILSDSCNVKNLGSIEFQEYPPGVVVMPMRSRTASPFSTTNLVTVAPQDAKNCSAGSGFVASGDALLIDPGCRSELHPQLMDIMLTMPRRLVVFVTHHHKDHVDGLTVVKQCNPDTTLLAHDKTMSRIGNELWPLPYTAISGGEKIYIGGQELDIIAAPGHTDGHMALFHAATRTLVVGDHCVGQGSAFLDARSGGNMKDYFETTYKFLELSPRILVPMHGRINIWPMQLLCSYLQNRRERESSILEAIRSGAKTLYDITALVYHNVDPTRLFLASSNVRLHVDHLASQGKLPEDFSLLEFHLSCAALAL